MPTQEQTPTSANFDRHARIIARAAIDDHRTQATIENGHSRTYVAVMAYLHAQEHETAVGELGGISAEAIPAAFREGYAAAVKAFDAAAQGYLLLGGDSSPGVEDLIATLREQAFDLEEADRQEPATRRSDQYRVVRRDLVQQLHARCRNLRARHDETLAALAQAREELKTLQAAQEGA